MNHLENMIDVKRSTLAKLIAAFTSIALVLTMCNVSLFASHAWANDEEPAIEETQDQIEPTDEQPAFEEETPIAVDDEDEDEEEPAVEEDEGFAAEDETPAVEEDNGASVLVVAEEVVMSEAYAIAPMSVMEAKELRPTVTRQVTLTIKCGEETVVDCPRFGDPLVNHAAATYGTWQSSDFSITKSDDTTANVIATNVDSGTITHDCIGDQNLVCRHRVIFTINVEHNWVDVEAKDPTCTEPGNTDGQKCTTCDRTTVEVIPATGHAVVTDEAVAPTCETTGLTEGSHCATCGIVLVTQEVMPVLGHDWDEGIVTTDPTCTETGVKTFTCMREGCNATTTEDVAAKGHTEEVVPGKPTTCYYPGLTDGKKCSVCGEVLVAQEEIPQFDHSWGEWVVTVAPTCTEPGKETKSCSTCPTEQRRDVPATGHTAVTDAAVAPTCETTGLTEGSHCATCGTVLVAQEVVEATGHAYVATVTTEATCKSDGVRTYTCTHDADHTYTEAIPAIGHAYGEWIVVTPATIDGEGLEQRVCANDVNHVEERAIAAIPATTITWYDEDGTTELASMRYIQGTVEPSFAGEVPTKAEDADNTYAFSGWENMTRTDDTIAYRATYTATAKPVDPTPVDPTPVDPTPVDPTPVDPTPVDPTPVDPTPTPDDPAPVDPAPTPDDPTPVDPTPGPVPGDEGTGTGTGTGTDTDAGTVTAPAGETIVDDATPLAAAPAPGAAAAPAAPATETITDDGNPLAAFPGEETIDDDGNPLASFELTPQCWVHWLMLIGIVVTLFYGIGVVVNRRKDIQTVDELEAEVMGRRPVRRSTAHRSQEA